MEKVSIIIPAYNEESTISEIISQVLSQKLPFGLKKEIIVVNDGSMDKTAKKAANFSGKVILLDLKKNQGKGAAIRAGLEKSTGDIILIQDADLEVSPKDYPILITPIIKGGAKVVYGSRHLKKPQKVNPIFFWGGKFLTFLANFLYGVKITDQSTCYKVFKSEIIKKMNLRESGFEFCSEVTAKTGKMGIKICEVPISYFPRNRKSGKKLTIKDGIKAGWTLIKYRF